MEKYGKKFLKRNEKFDIMFCKSLYNTENSKGENVKFLTLDGTSFKREDEKHQNK